MEALAEMGGGVGGIAVNLRIRNLGNREGF